MPDGFARDSDQEIPDSVPLDLAEIRDVTGRALATDSEWARRGGLSRFHSDERQVRYRVGRVLLAAQSRTARGTRERGAGREKHVEVRNRPTVWFGARAVHGGIAGTSEPGVRIS